ncbi:juxtaposed with another zinc finger protein 1 isoform X2 [Copidosoma floridanum]|uniref:juxtaposed with another zinc finger protein 1 isoform X2 n=1 Tax=Copidosoma floridanum TaxID=29053 RepID=UPI000C6F44BA|nr:juxtaposed with another zinc finger protein 1 isoform X2 [Copidosoma floridanum]
MAVFLLNVCKFNSCGLKFQSLGHLIQHIEETHIDYDPHVVERTEQQQPACIPLSYVLRFLTDREINSNKQQQQQQQQQIATTNAQQQQQLSRPASQSSIASSTTSTTTNNSSGGQRICKSLTPTGSEAEEGEDFLSEPEDSNDSCTTLEEFSQDFILRYGSRCVLNTSHNTANQSNKGEKRFVCPVPGCDKSYKNMNGIKYHSKNGHKNDGKVKKAYKCPCGKSYKKIYGLNKHTNLRHNHGVPKNRLEDKHLQKYQHSRPILPKIPKIKVPAIQDHGYMKQEHYSGEADSEYEISSLGILTPAASPPLPSPTQPQIYSNKHHHHFAGSMNSSQTHRPCDN